MTVADQRATQKLLTAALNILKGFYAKKAKAALVQVQQPAGPPPPPGFAAYNKNAAAGGVMGMITQIINDAKAMEAEVFHCSHLGSRYDMGCCTHAGLCPPFPADTYRSSPFTGCLQTLGHSSLVFGLVITLGKN